MAAWPGTAVSSLLQWRAYEERWPYCDAGWPLHPQLEVSIGSVVHFGGPLAGSENL